MIFQQLTAKCQQKIKAESNFRCISAFICINVIIIEYSVLPDGNLFSCL